MASAFTAGVNRANTIERRFSISSETSEEQDSEGELNILDSSDAESSSEFETESIQSNYDLMRNRQFMPNETMFKESFTDFNDDKNPHSDAEESQEILTPSSNRVSESINALNISSETDDLESELERELDKVNKQVESEEKESFESSETETEGLNDIQFEKYSFNNNEKNNFFNMGKPVLTKTEQNKSSFSETEDLSRYFESLKMDTEPIHESNEEEKSTDWKNIILTKLTEINTKQEVNEAKEEISVVSDEEQNPIDNDDEVTSEIEILEVEENLLHNRIEELFQDKKCNEIILLNITTEFSISSSVEVIESYLYTGHQYENESDHLRLKFKRSKTLKKKVILNFNNFDISADNLTRLHLSIKELKSIEIKSNSCDLFTALLLLLKLASTERSNESTDLIEKLELNFKICLRRWMRHIPKHIISLCLNASYSKHSCLQYFELFLKVCNSLMTSGYYEEARLALKIMNDHINKNIVTKGIVNSIYNDLTIDDIKLYLLNLHDFMIGTGASYDRLEPNESNLEECISIISTFKQNLSTLIDLNDELNNLFNLKQKSKELFMNGKKTTAKEIYCDILNLNHINLDKYILFKSIILSNRAACYISLCEYEKALLDCNQVLQLNPTNIKGKVRKAKVLMKQYKFDQALNELKTALKEHPKENSLMDDIRKVILEKELYRQRQQASKETRNQRYHQQPSTTILKELTAQEIIDCSDHYAIFQATKYAKIRDIKKSYHKLALKFHPDKASNIKDRTLYEEAFKKIASCFEILKDPEKRRIYDVSKGNNVFFTPRSSTKKQTRYETHGHYTYSYGYRHQNFTKHYSYS